MTSTHIKIIHLFCDSLTCHCRPHAIRGEDLAPSLCVSHPSPCSSQLVIVLCICELILDHFLYGKPAGSPKEQGFPAPCTPMLADGSSAHGEGDLCFPEVKGCSILPFGVQPHLSFLSLPHLLILSLLFSRAVPSPRTPHTIGPMHSPESGPSLVHRRS